jgi:hypothetical protein
VIYSFNFRTVLTRQLPRRKRTTKRIAWIYSLLYPAKLIHDEFVTLVQRYKDEMKWNAQRILLQRALILKFGVGIVVVNQNPSSWVLIGYAADDSRNPVAAITPEFSNVIGQVAGTGTFGTIGFIVEVPMAIVFDQNEMKAFINLYVQQSTYSIVII